MKKLTIILLGKQGVGKSTSGNTLLGIHSFHTSPSLQGVTQAISVSMSTVGEQTIEVIDTPGWCDSPQFKTEMKPNIIRIIDMYKPNVFLLLLPIDRFTTEELETVMNILKEIGDEAIKNMIVLFTKGDGLEGTPIEDYLEVEDVPNLKRIIKICGDRYHVFNNRDKTDHQQISSLLKKINDLVEKNEENLYMKAMYEKSKRGQTLKADNSVPGENKGPTENEKRRDDRRRSCDEEGEEKGETLKKNKSPTENEKRRDDRRSSCDEEGEEKGETLKKNKSRTENEKRRYDRRSSCDEEGEEKGETFVDRKEPEKLLQEIEQTGATHKTTLDFPGLMEHWKRKEQIEIIDKTKQEISRTIEDWKNGIQKLGREMQTGLDKIKNELHLNENQ